MRTASYIDATTTERIRARAISYVHSDIAAGVTLREHRRSGIAPRSGGSASRAVRRIARMAARYPDDPVGNYETTSGVW
jgi:hypothetical protein